MFLVLLLFVRITGMRSFGQSSAIDSVIIILLGSIAARGVVGATPFVSTVAGVVVLMGAHKLLAFAAFKWRGVGKVVKGRECLMYRDGKFFESNMSREGISVNDIHEQLRIKTDSNSLDDIHAVYFERNGELSFVKKSKG